VGFIEARRRDRSFYPRLGRSLSIVSRPPRAAASASPRGIVAGTRFADSIRKEDLPVMRFLKPVTALMLVALVSVVLAACTSTTGKTAGESVDDMTITSEVKAKLAAEKISTLTKIGVDTDRRTVYLTGTVDDPEMRARAEEIARNVKHVSGVVNNLTVRTQ
jgi:hyperosmotically inducible periplasmic protein